MTTFSDDPGMQRGLDGQASEEARGLAERCGFPSSVSDATCVLPPGHPADSEVRFHRFEVAERCLCPSHDCHRKRARQRRVCSMCAAKMCDPAYGRLR